MKALNSLWFKFINFFTHDKRSSIIWLVVRVYVGYKWLIEGWHKFGEVVWTGPQAGVAVTGFLNGALTKMVGEHPNVSEWYGWLITNIFLPNAEVISYFVVYGEILVGIALILGLFTRLAAWSGVFMNFNYLFAGTVSSNPLLLLLGLMLMKSYIVAEHIGIKWVIDKVRGNNK